MKCLIGAVLVLVCTASAHASTILLSDFGPSDSYQTPTFRGWAVGQSAPTLTDQLAVPYTNRTGMAYDLDRIRVANERFLGENALTLDLWQGVDLGTATLLETFVFHANDFETAQIFTAIPTHPIALLPGETYWVREEIPDTEASTEWGWQWNDQGALGYEAKFGESPWFEEFGVRPALEIAGTPSVNPIPEPATLVLLGLGLLGLARYKHS